MSKTLLDLPTELLDHVFSSLDWDRRASLIPIKPDIMSASLVCKQLRRVLIPILFKDVVLRLRWSEGELVEPCLFRLRRQRPELSRHIRCVFIRTEFEQCPHCAAKGEPSAFTMPKDIVDWMHPSNTTHSNVAHQSCRERANAIAQRIQTNAGVLDKVSASAESMVRVAREASKNNVDADALQIVMLCIPSSTQTVIFQSLPDDSLHQTRNDFAMRAFSFTIEMLGSRIRDLTLISTSAIGVPRRVGRRIHGLEPNPNNSALLPSNVVQSLRLSELTIALTDRSGFTGQRTHLTYGSVSLWHGVSDWIRELNIRNTSSEYNEALCCIKGFRSLRSLRFQQTGLYLPQPPLMAGQGQGRHRAAPQRNVWLLFVVELRQALQHVEIQLESVYTFPTHTMLSDSAVSWIMGEAVPNGCLIDADRQERLLQDFDSFLPLWEAEDGERGSRALHSWREQRSKLCDDAMSGRWR